MIKLVCMDKRDIVINANLIEQVEAVPETVITLTSGRKVIVKDTVEEVLRKAAEYHRYIHRVSKSIPDEVS